MCREDQIRKLLRKLDTRMDDVPLDSAKRLCSAVAALGPIIPDPPGELGRPFLLAGLLIRKVLRRINEDRKAFALKILADAQPLSFGVVCLGLMELQRDEIPSERLFSPADEKDLNFAFADRISKAATRTELLSDRAEYLVRLLKVWQQAKGSAEVKDHLRSVFSSDPGSAEKFILLFYPGHAQVDQPTHDFIIQLCDPADLIKAFKLARLLDSTRNDVVAQLARSFKSIYDEGYPA